VPEHEQRNDAEWRSPVGSSLKQTPPPIDEATHAARCAWSRRRSDLALKGRTPQEIDRETGPQPGALIRRCFDRRWLTRTDRVHLLTVRRFIVGELRAPEGALAQHDLFDDAFGCSRWYRLPTGAKRAA
jgi:hypothetical protein